MQEPIPFEEVIEALSWLKKMRRTWLAKTKIFSDREMDFLVKLTYDLTDKDFEYFVAILLEWDGYSTKVQWWLNDGGVDILAMKDGKILAIQCKQWSKAHITKKDAGAFLGSVDTEKQRNPDRIFAYVTTSYVVPDAEIFLQNQGIQWIISNKKLVWECRKLWYFTERWWERLILEIRQRRLKDLSKKSQLSLDSGYEALKKELRSARLSELKHHLPRDIRYKKSTISPIQHWVFLASFFQYWNLV